MRFARFGDFDGLNEIVSYTVLRRFLGILRFL